MPPSLSCESDNGRHLIEELAALGGAASRIPKELRLQFVGDFETAMAAYYAANRHDASDLLAEMAQYFVQFHPGPDHYYLGLVESVAETGHEAILAPPTTTS